MLMDMLKMIFQPTAFWESNSKMLRPAGTNSTLQTAARDSDCFSPSGYAFGNPVDSDNAVGASVSALLGVSSPSTIRFAVSERIVQTVNAVFSRWSSTHISNKVFELIPSFADSNASTTVSRKGMVVPVCATRLHCCPNFELSALAHPVRQVTDGCSRFLVAAARLCVAVFQRLTNSSDGIATLTKAVPTSFTVFSIFRSTDNSQSTKSLPSDIIEFSHFDTPISFWLEGGSSNYRSSILSNAGGVV